MKRLIALAVALVVLACAVAVAPRLVRPKSMAAWAEVAAAAHGNALWHIVHDLCTPDMRASGNPAPCVSVDLPRGFAVVKDIQGKTQYLLIPTTRVPGIESPQLLASGSPNYWSAAWDARKLVEDRIGRPVPREDIGLAVNSISRRTQNQLHIHIDCLRADIRDSVRQNQRRIGPRWTIVSLGRHHRRYRARWLAGSDLGERDPFKILADSDPAARAHMGDETLALVGASRPNGAPGFVLLTTPGDGSPDDDAAAEEVLDHRCVIAHESSTPGPVAASSIRTRTQGA